MKLDVSLAALSGVGLRVGIAGLFVVAPRPVVDVEVHGLEYDAGAPHTYFAILHKRDLDSMAPLPAILRHGGWARLTRDVRFAMRADSFERGFLSRVVRRPAIFSHALHPLTVGPVLRLVGVQPIAGFHTRPSETWLRDVLVAEGDLCADEVLAPAAIEALAAATGEPVERIGATRLSRLLTWRYTHHLPLLSGPDLLAGMVRRRAERRAVAEAKARLGAAAEWLRAGGSLYGSPEGGFSPTGRVGRITAGFHRLMQAAPEATLVVPVALMYDFMTRRKMRLFVDLAPAIERARDLPRGELEQRLRRAWRSAARFTCTQLGAAFLVERSQRAESVFTRTELAAAVAVRARELAAMGRHVDARLLSWEGAARAASSFLAYAARHGYAQPTGRDASRSLWRAMPGELDFTVPPGEVGYPRWPLAYAWNEYRDLLALDVLVKSPRQPVDAPDVDTGRRPSTA